MTTPFRVQWWYRGKSCGFTTFGDEQSARTFAKALRKRGIRLVCISPV